MRPWDFSRFTFFIVVCLAQPGTVHATNVTSPDADVLQLRLAPGASDHTFAEIPSVAANGADAGRTDAPVLQLGANLTLPSTGAFHQGMIELNGHTLDLGSRDDFTSPIPATVQFGSSPRSVLVCNNLNQFKNRPTLVHSGQGGVLALNFTGAIPVSEFRGLPVGKVKISAGQTLTITAN